MVRFIITGLLALMLAAPSASAAGGSATTVSQYGGESAVQGTLVTGTSAPKAAGTLPFTGLDLGVIVLAGVALVVMGVSLRRYARREHL